MNISETVGDRAISSEFLKHRVVKEYFVATQKNSIFFKFWRKTKNVNISETVRDRAISTKFLTHMVQKRYYVSTQKNSIFTTFGGHLGFLWKTKNREYLHNMRVASKQQALAYFYFVDLNVQNTKSHRHFLSRDILAMDM